MATPIDIAVEQNDEGLFEINFEDGDFKKTAGFDTALAMSTYEERRAAASEHSITFLRRGWVGNLFSEVPRFEIGSKLWLLYQARRTQRNLNLAVTYANEGYLWLVEDGHLKGIRVNSSFIERGINIIMETTDNNNRVETRSFELWQNTGIN